MSWPPFVGIITILIRYIEVGMVMIGFVGVFMLTALRIENVGNSSRMTSTAWRRRVGEKDDS